MNDEAPFRLQGLFFYIYKIPAFAFIMEVKPLHRIESNALFVLMIKAVDKALECIEVAFVTGYVRSKTTSFLIHVGHLLPAMVEYIKFLTRFHHGLLLIAATHYVYEPITEIIVGSKRGTPFFNWGELFEILGI